MEQTATLERLFGLANLAVLPGWALMVCAPRAAVTQRLINSDAFFIGMGGLYTAMLGGALAANPEAGKALLSPSLTNIGKLFKYGGPKATFAAWVHYLVFDFFVGRAILRDSQAQGIPHLLILPALFFTLMSGPLGLAYYRLLVWLRGNRTPMR